MKMCIWLRLMNSVRNTLFLLSTESASNSTTQLNQQSALLLGNKVGKSRIVKIHATSLVKQMATNHSKIQNLPATDSYLKILEDLLAGKRLTLHFDIRNTILLADSVSQIGVEQCLNAYLTSVAWGVVEDHRINGNREAKKWWTCVDNSATIDNPHKC